MKLLRCEFRHPHPEPVAHLPSGVIDGLEVLSRNWQYQSSARKRNCRVRNGNGCWRPLAPAYSCVGINVGIGWRPCLR